MITDLKEINKYFRTAKSNFNRAIELAKSSLIIGEVKMVVPEKKVKIPRKRKAVEDLPDLDKTNKFYGGGKES